MAKKTERAARALRDELKDKHGISITYKELSTILGYQVKAITPIEGATSIIIQKIKRHRGESSDADTSATRTDQALAALSAEAQPKSGVQLVESLLEGGSIAADGKAVREVVTELSRQGGVPVTSAQVLDALGFFGNDDTFTDVSIDEIESRLQEQSHATLPGTFGAVLAFYRQQGHIGLMPSTTKLMLKRRVDGIEAWENDTVLSEVQQTTLASWLNQTLKICVKMAEDARLPVGAQDRRVVNPEAPIEQRSYEFTARCGHLTRQSHQDAVGNLANDNLSVGTWKQLCDPCAEVRARILMTPPDAAKEGQLTCRRCEGQLFKSGLHGLILSRGHIWQNGMRNVLSINSLLNRLEATHRLADPICVANRKELLQRQQASQREMVMACDNDIAEVELRVMDLINESPQLKKSLTESLPDTIKKIRANHGFPVTNVAYQKLRRQVGLQTTTRKAS